jgi:hypothetical protein
VPVAANRSIYQKPSLATQLAIGPAINWTHIPKIVTIIAKLSPLLLLSPNALYIPILSLLPISKKHRVILIALTLLPSCLAAPTTLQELTAVPAGVQSLAATAYAQYIAAEITEPDVRSSITPIINGSKPSNTDNILHGWTQNFRGCINNTFKWCGLVDCLIEEEPDFAVLTETSSDNAATDLLFLHRQMYKEDPDNENPPKIDENLPYNIKNRFAKMADWLQNSKFHGHLAMQCLILRFTIWTLLTTFGAFIIICSIFSFRFPAFIGWISCLLFLLRIFADPSYLRLHFWKRISDSPFLAFVLNQLSTALFYVGVLALAFMLKDTVGFDGSEAQISLSVKKGWWKPAHLSASLHAAELEMMWVDRRYSNFSRNTRNSVTSLYGFGSVTVTLPTQLAFRDSICRQCFPGHLIPQRCCFARLGAC